MSKYQIMNTPMLQSGPNIWDVAKKFALDKGLKMAASGGNPYATGAAEFARMAAPALGFNKGGNVHGPLHPQEKTYRMKHKDHLTGVAEYKKHGGSVGPLAKTVMKDKDGNSSERHYHNPLAGGSTSQEK